MTQNKIDNIFYEILVSQLEKNKDKKIAFWGASLFLEDLLSRYDISEYKNIVGIIDKNVTNPDNIPFAETRKYIKKVQIYKMVYGLLGKITEFTDKIDIPGGIVWKT